MTWSQGLARPCVSTERESGTHPVRTVLTPLQAVHRPLPPLPINRPRSAVTQFKRSHNTTALSVQTLGDLTPILVPKKRAMQLTTQVGKQKGQL